MYRNVAAVANGKTKSQIVRETLEELGLLTENPPQGWMDRVKRALDRSKVSVHLTTIYQIRRREMQKIELPQLEAVAVKADEEKVLTDSYDLGKLTLAEARDIKIFAQKFGGLQGLREVIQAIESLST